MRVIIKQMKDKREAKLDVPPNENQLYCCCTIWKPFLTTIFSERGEGEAQGGTRDRSERGKEGRTPLPNSDWPKGGLFTRSLLWNLARRLFSSFPDLTFLTL